MSFSLENKTLQDLKFLSKEDVSLLESKDFDAKNTVEKESLLLAHKTEVNRSKLYINKADKKYTLDLKEQDEVISSFDDVITALDNFSRLYISHQVFTQTKNAHLGQLRKELKALEKKVKSAEKRIAELNRASGYKEKADLLMANMWQIQKGAKEVKLSSFDGEKEITIKLQEMLTPQANAERYYKKGKK